MQSRLAFDTTVFEKMKKAALDALAGAGRGEYTQAIVLFSASGNIYSALVRNALSKEMAEEIALMEKLKAAADTKIRYVLCVWQNGGIDIPSCAFRRMLYDLTPKNGAALLFMITAEGVGTRALSTTIQ